MIYGIGADIVAVSRVNAILQKHGERFAERILGQDEWPDYEASNTPGRFLAKRFAAKEAFAKAFGTGLRHPVNMPSILVTHDALGKPLLRFSPALEALLAQSGIHGRHLSISDEKELVAAFVVLEK